MPVRDAVRMKGLSVLATLLLLLVAHQLSARMRGAGNLPVKEKNTKSRDFTQSTLTSTVPVRVYSL